MVLFHEEMPVASSVVSASAINLECKYLLHLVI
uniref:Uncharacterized protein n=1 Tax=Arundo donax TaxID=35708 RepID=A0A0A8XR85_ARUDO